MTKPALLLLPNLLGEHRHHEPYLPGSVDRAVITLNGLIAESDREARRFLSRFKMETPVHLIPVAILNVNTKPEDIDFLLEPIIQGERWGYLSDAGLPCVADPGAILVRRARQRGIAIQAFTGPCSITLALMLSGLEGQRFAFHGYIDKEESRRAGKIKQLEKRSKEDRATQIFMEAPYKNDYLLQHLIDTLDPETYLCVAWDLTLPSQSVVCQQVGAWKRIPLPQIKDKPAQFMVYAADLIDLRKNSNPKK